MKEQLAVVVAFTLLMLGCASPAPPRTSYDVLQPGEPRLASGSLLFLGPDGNVYTILENENQVRQVTTEAEANSQVLRYSGYTWVDHDIVYVSQKQTETGSIDSAMYRTSPLGRPERLFTEPGSAPFFLNPSPTGDRIGYLGSREGADGYVMASVDLQSKRRVLHGQGSPFYAAWAPDGRSLVTHVGQPLGEEGSDLTVQRVAELDRASPEVEPLALTPGFFQTPAYSPAGDAVAVVLDTDGGGTAIHLLDPSGENNGRLIPVRGAVSFAWSPNGSQFAYLDGVIPSGVRLAGPLSIIGRRARSPRVVSNQALAFFWSPDGTKLLYLEPAENQEDGERPLRYRVGLYEALTGESRLLATIRSSPEFVSQFLPFFDQYIRSYTIWSPDSTLVALNTLAVTGERLVVLVDTDTTGGFDGFRVSYAPDIEVQENDGSSLGIVTPEGISFRVLAYGTIPFFSPHERPIPED
jgi:TolB protein